MIKNKNNRKFAKFPRRHSRAVLMLDMLMLILGIIGPLTAIAQVIQIVSSHNAGSVSLFSWGFFLVGNGVALLYGFVHRLLPIIISQALWVMMDIAVVVSVVIYS